MKRAVAGIGEARYRLAAFRDCANRDGGHGTRHFFSAPRGEAAAGRYCW
jgi:hypothetical protein